MHARGEATLPLRIFVIERSTHGTHVFHLILLQDGDGKISVREFCDMVLGHDNKLIPEEDMEELVAQMDKNGDGLVRSSSLESAWVAGVEQHVDVWQLGVSIVQLEERVRDFLPFAGLEESSFPLPFFVYGSICTEFDTLSVPSWSPSPACCVVYEYSLLCWHQGRRHGSALFEMCLGDSPLPSFFSVQIDWDEFVAYMRQDET